MEYANWWLTALSLSGITLAFWLIIRRPLGVSGSWGRVVVWKKEAEITQIDKPFQTKSNTMVESLMAATMEAFGDEKVKEALEKYPGKIPGLSTISETLPVERRLPWTGHLLFLLMLPVGGLITSMYMGNFNLQFDLGELHRNLFGSGFPYILTLFFGGALIGFGTQLSNGCTTGHGMSGIARLIPASFIATCSFFASAVIISLLLKYL